MTHSDVGPAQFELEDIEGAHDVALIRWLIRSAEAVFESWGGDDRDKWDANQPLKLAFQEGSADLTRIGLEHDQPYDARRGEELIRDLANAITIRFGEEPSAQWDYKSLATLAGRIK